MKAVNVGVIGAGIIAPEHIRAYQQVTDVKVGAICDLVPEKARKLATEYGIEKVFTDYRELLADPEINAVSVCTDHASHAAISIAALEAGKHVLCEKPLGASVEDLNRMEEAGKQHPELVFEGVFQHRFDRSYRYAKELIHSPRFGKILNASLSMQCLRTNGYYNADAWRGTWAMEGGSLMMNQAIHFVDMLQWLLNGADHVCGFFANLDHQSVIETEDTAVAVLRFRNGILGTIHATSSSHLGWEADISIYGVDSTLQMRGNDLLRFVSRNPELEKEVYEKFQDFASEEKNRSEKYYYGIGHPAQLEDFIASIREKRSPFIPVSEARCAVDIAQRIYGRSGSRKIASGC